METTRGSEEPHPHPHLGDCSPSALRPPQASSRRRSLASPPGGRNGTHWCFMDACAVNTQNFLQLFRISRVNTHIPDNLSLDVYRAAFSECSSVAEARSGVPTQGEEGSREQIPESHFLAHTLHPVPLPW